MQKIYTSKKIWLATLVTTLCLNCFSQLGKLDTLYYGGKGVDFKCTGGLVLPDSSIIITGKFVFVNERQINGIVKLTKDGVVDYSFNTGTGADEHVNVVVRQPDGKLIIGGDFITFNGQVKNHIARLNPDGSLDATFNSGTGCDGSIYTLYLQPDGKILVGGAFVTYNGSSVGRIIRLNTDGTQDLSFQSTDGFDGDVFSIDMQTDKKFVVGGSFSTYNDSACVGIGRIDSSGVFDNTFNNGGAGTDNIVTNATVLPNGKIIAAGYFTFYNGSPAARVVRINTNGSIDNTFITGAGFNNNVNELVVQPDGKILLTGNFTQYNGTGINRVVRLDTTGTRDASFNPGAGPNLSCNTVFLNPDNKIYIGGTFTQIDSFARLRFARLESNGLLDKPYLFDSKVNGQIWGIGFQSSGKAIIGGQFTTYNNKVVNRVARLSIDGSIDTTFVSNPAANDIVRAIAVSPDDKILVAGDFTSYNGSTAGHLVRLNADGTTDNTFTSGTGANNDIYNVTLLSNGKILITGSFTQYNGTTINRIARLNSNGTLDNSFVVGTGINNIGRDIAVQPDGKIILAGSFATYNGNASSRIVRIDSFGTYDNTFTVGTSANNIVYSVALQPDGKIVIGGVFTSYNGTTKDRIARLNANGTLDAGYTASCAAQVSDIFPIYNSPFFAGGMLVGGLFTTVNGTTRNRIVLLDENGAIDSMNYYVGTGADATVNVIANNTIERKLFVGGDFKGYQDHVANRLAALQNGYIRVENLSTTLCPGVSTKVYFRKAETFFGNNVFTIQMSDASGNFANGVNVGTQNSVDIGADSATITIPANTPNGTGYRFRIVSSNPDDTSNITLPIEISSSATATISTTDATVFCSGGNATLAANSGDQYSWSNGETTQSIVVNSTGNYSATVTTAGCAAVSNTINVTVNQSPDSSVTITSTTICNGGTATLQAALGLSYLWSTSETDSVIHVTQSGPYTVTVSNGACSADSTINVNLITSSNLISTLDPTTFCAGGSATLSSQPGLTYSWSTGATTQSITVSSQGNYDVTVNDGTCSDTSSVIAITVNALPNVQLPQQNEICSNFTPEVVLSAGTPSGGTYSGSAFISSDTLYALNAFNASVDSIDVIYTYTDNNSCTASDTTLQAITVCGGIDEVKDNFSIVPNPATNYITITTTEAIIKNLTVFNILGETVLTQNSDVKRSTTTIDVSSFSAGIYFVQIGESKLRFIKAE